MKTSAPVEAHLAQQPGEVLAVAVAVSDEQASVFSSPPISGGGAALPVSAGDVNVQRMMAYLLQHQWPPGLIEQAILSSRTLATRYFIVDDSGSMATADGNKVTSIPGGQPGQARHEKCTRWEEMRLALRFHVGLAQAGGGQAIFMFLNGPTVSLPRDGAQGVALIEATLDGSPRGGTPLCARIGEVVGDITSMAATLRQSRQQAALIVMTDGESSDGDLAAAMRPLERLPVWVVIRLSTDEDKVVSYWNSIDEQLELELDVLDDLVSEAKEIRAVNPFVVYGESLQRLREWGYHGKELDLLDEQQLTCEQMHAFVKVLLGSAAAAALPHPSTDNMHLYAAAVASRVAALPRVHNCITKNPDTWIDTTALQRTYGKPSCTIS